MKKKNKKSQNYNLKNKKNVKTCLYKLNNICGDYHTSYYGYKCGGSLKCDFFKQYSNNNFQYDIKITQNSDIILCIIIPDIQYTSFLSTRNIVSPYITYTSFPDKKRALYVKTINIKGVSLHFKLEFYSSEGYIEFLFCNFSTNVKKINNQLSITIDNPIEIINILETPYNKITPNITIHHKIKNKYGELNLSFNIPKQILFQKLDQRTSIQPINKNTKQAVVISKETNKSNNLRYNKNISIQKQIVDVGITAIILSYNKKCNNENHNIIDIIAKLRIVFPNGKIDFYYVPAAYCKDCNKYFMLKKDFDDVKKHGTILCEIIGTEKSLLHISSKKYQSTSESRIHQLGYNVQKGFGLTNNQREIILANIVENTNITKHEISSHIQRCINQHKKQQNYKDAVQCWHHDYEFVSNYKHGDLPEVIIEKIKMGR